MGDPIRGLLDALDDNGELCEMTDEELIARLRELGDHASFEPHMHHKAADRIEALTEQLTAARQDAKEAEAYAEELEAKLAKAVEMALEECPFRWGTPNYDNWWRDRRATLAEFKGESHD